MATDIQSEKQLNMEDKKPHERTITMIIAAIIILTLFVIMCRCAITAQKHTHPRKVVVTQTRTVYTRRHIL